MASELKYLLGGLTEDLGRTNWTGSERTTTDNELAGSAVRY